MAHPGPVGPTCLFADLTPTAEAPGPHDFTVRFGTARLHAPQIAHEPEGRPAIPTRARRRRVHRIPVPTFVTMANAPSSGTGWRELKSDLPGDESGNLPVGVFY